MPHAKASAWEVTMAAEQRKPWNTPDFELKFREAMGRNMTHQEKEFFGLDDQDSSGNDQPETRSNSNSAKFAWQALRRISALYGLGE
jgi:hypothetical protein